jgi:hypothetical protein
VRKPHGDSLAVAIAAGLALGLATRYVYELPYEWHWLAHVGVPWLAAAFAVGALGTRPARGALNGAAALVAAVLIFYVPALVGIAHWSYASSAIGLGWAGFGLPGGALFGALGALYAGGRARVVSVSILTACFGAEAVLFALLVPHPGAPAPTCSPQHSPRRSCYCAAPANEPGRRSRRRSSRAPRSWARPPSCSSRAT